jgi:4-diphosphocytidyl-2-C-methyl-D-erythritol kinase
MAYNLASMTVRVRSFAKINLGLCIGAAREDGFHELLTVYQTIGLHDFIHVSVGRGSGIEIRCTDMGVPKDESNTCYRVVEMAMAAMKSKGRVTIEIEKRLPVQGGMGGASSNAVATLLGLERVLKKALPAEERLRIAAQVGSDLPLFLVGGTVLGVGRGELVYPLADFAETACVVVTPEVGVSTPKAFAEWDRRMAECRQGLKPALFRGDDAALKRRSSTVDDGCTVDGGATVDGRDQKTAELRSAWTGKGARPYTSSVELRSTGQPGAAVPTEAVPTRAVFTQGFGGKLTMGKASDRMSLLGRGFSAWLGESYSGAPLRRGRAENPLLELVRAGIKNDFEEVVFPEYPELSEIKNALERAGAKYASLSGSGSTLYGLFASKEAASAAVTKLQKQGWAARATVTMTRKKYWRGIFAG